MSAEASTNCTTRLMSPGEMSRVEVGDHILSRNGESYSVREMGEGGATCCGDEDNILGDNYSDYSCDSIGDSDASVNECDDNTHRARSETGSRCYDPVSAPYIEDMTRSSGLHIAERARVVNAYEAKGELGLFSLFITRELKDRIIGWTNDGLKVRGKEETNEHELDA
ncbi:unnamed protein product [Phytophthora fragariaefolia]|uniref:Unnamed protein product n=1 Tax=Phytophthora fragariaefolia TaxID=1490495 RepID=A0A9W6XBA6_9STRA|nr:unnamed protein product [Phytophthora fragariaefolia]